MATRVKTAGTSESSTPCHRRDDSLAQIVARIGAVDRAAWMVRFPTVLMVAEEILAEIVGSPAEVGGDTSFGEGTYDRAVTSQSLFIALQRFCAAARAPAPILSIPNTPGVRNARGDGPERGRIDDVDRSREQGRLTVQ